MFLSSFFAWASTEFKIEDPTDRVQPPRFQPKPVEPLTREEVQAMVHACELAQPAAWWRGSIRSLRVSRSEGMLSCVNCPEERALQGPS